MVLRFESGAYLSEAKTARWLFERLGLLGKIENLTVELRKAPEGMWGRLSGYYDGKKIVVYTGNPEGNLYDPETIERTFIHEMFHAGKGGGGEAGARALEIYFMLKRQADRLRRKRKHIRSTLERMREELHSWLLNALVGSYEVGNWELWSYLTVKKGIRKFGSHALKIFEGRDPAALAYIARYASPISVLVTILINPRVLDGLGSVTYLSKKDKKELCRKLWEVAKRLATSGLSRKYYDVVARLLVEKQMLEGRKRFDKGEIYALAGHLPEERRAEFIRETKKEFWKILLKKSAKEFRLPRWIWGSDRA